MNLPFPSASYDAVTVAFGLRNMASYPDALREMGRMLRPGGHLLILDFSLPESLLKSPYRFYLHRILPVIAGWMTGHREAGHEGSAAGMRLQQHHGGSSERGNCQHLHSPAMSAGDAIEGIIRGKAARARLGGKLAGLSLPRQIAVIAFWPFLEQLLSFFVTSSDLFIATKIGVDAQDTINISDGMGAVVFIMWFGFVIQGAIMMAIRLYGRICGPVQRRGLCHQCRPARLRRHAASLLDHDERRHPQCHLQRHLRLCGRSSGRLAYRRNCGRNGLRLRHQHVHPAVHHAAAQKKNLHGQEK